MPGSTTAAAAGSSCCRPTAIPRKSASSALADATTTRWRSPKASNRESAWWCRATPVSANPTCCNFEGDPMLKLVNASKKFVGGEVMTTALDDVALEIQAGEYLAVMGPSGCGKSTLLSILGMLDTPDAGEYWFGGKNVAGLREDELNELRRGRVGFIFQSFNLIEELNVEENVALALEYGELNA